MPCRKENYLFVEQAVSVDSAEVDALVTRIGEALQLHGGGLSAGGAAAGYGGSSGRHAAGSSAGAPQRRRGARSRAGPYSLPGSGEPDWEHLTTWRRKALGGGSSDDPQRLLQELVLSGNLIKEAVRRLQLSD